MSKIYKEDIDNIEVATIIGSPLFETEMEMKASVLQSCGILPLIGYPISKKSNLYFEATKDTVIKEAYKRIDLSDFVVCINKDGYIDEITIREYYYATFIKRIPVFFDVDKVSKEMIKYLNYYWVDTQDNLHLWNDNLLSLLYIKAIYVRNTCYSSQDVLDLALYDEEILHYYLNIDLKKQCDMLAQSPDKVQIINLSANEFESKLKESKLFIG